MDLGLTGRRFLVGGASRGLGAATARALVAEGARVAGASRHPDPGPATGAAGDRAGRGGPVDSRRRRRRPSRRGRRLRRPRRPRRQHRRAAWQARSPRSTRRPGSAPSPAPCRAPSGSSARALPHLRDGRDPAIVVDPLVVGPRADPGAGDIERPPTRPGRPDQEPGQRDRADPDQRRRTRPLRHRAGARPRRGPGRGHRRRASRIVQAQTRARIPLGRYGDPAELGRVVTFLLSPAASYLDGVILAVDGGMIRSLP